jgi:hypothetical protein
MRYLCTDDLAVGATGGEYGFKVEDKKDLTIRNKLNDLGNGHDFIVKNDGQNYIVTPESDEARSALKTYVNSLKEQGFNVVHEDINGSFNIAKKDVPDFVSSPAEKGNPEKMIALRYNDKLIPDKIIDDKIITERNRLNLKIAVASALADSPLAFIKAPLSDLLTLTKEEAINIAPEKVIPEARSHNKLPSVLNDLILTTEQKKQRDKNTAKARDIITTLGLENKIKVFEELYESYDEEDIFIGLKNEEGEPLVALKVNINTFADNENKKIRNALGEAGIPFIMLPSYDW